MTQAEADAEPTRLTSETDECWEADSEAGEDTADALIRRFAEADEEAIASPDAGRRGWCGSSLPIVLAHGRRLSAESDADEDSSLSRDQMPMTAALERCRYG